MRVEVGDLLIRFDTGDWWLIVDEKDGRLAGTCVKEGFSSLGLGATSSFDIELISKLGLVPDSDIPEPMLIRMTKLKLLGSE